MRGDGGGHHPAGAGERRGVGPGGLLTLTFNEDLDITATKLPPADAFTVKADGVEVAVTALWRGAKLTRSFWACPPPRSARTRS